MIRDKALLADLIDDLENENAYDFNERAFVGDVAAQIFSYSDLYAVVQDVLIPNNKERQGVFRGVVSTPIAPTDGGQIYHKYDDVKSAFDTMGAGWRSADLPAYTTPEQLLKLNSMVVDRDTGRVIDLRNIRGDLSPLKHHQMHYHEWCLDIIKAMVGDYLQANLWVDESVETALGGVVFDADMFNIWAYTFGGRPPLTEKEYAKLEDEIRANSLYSSDVAGAVAKFMEAANIIVRIKSVASEIIRDVFTLVRGYENNVYDITFIPATKSFILKRGRDYHRLCYEQMIIDKHLKPTDDQF